MIIGNKEFDVLNRTNIMGILNLTPDSFSDGGRFICLDDALRQAELMLIQGADIIDVGGESTRPGYSQISEQEELERILPVIERLASEFDTVISVDTYKSAVADEALKAGASMVNDIWGFKYDDKMAHVVAKHGACCCLMHNRKEAVYADFLQDVLEDLKGSIEIAKAAGIADDRIILDPGIGFGKTYEMNLTVLKNLEYFRKLGYPMLLGASRKSVIGEALDLPKDCREEGTIATSVLAAESGYAFVRVHDVEKNLRAIRMTEAIMKA
ncbi:MAG: dihydropteroate synthase [Mogibacterium sp.]|nr:dihydropteroate synthase [Mogibacterium sp.]